MATPSLRISGMKVERRFECWPTLANFVQGPGNIWPLRKRGAELMAVILASNRRALAPGVVYVG